MEAPAFYNPSKLSGVQLDDFLSQGWYRMHQTVFTTKHIVLNAAIYNVYWLRYNLAKINLSKKLKKILLHNNQFTISIKPIVVTAELEALYASYRASIKFDHSESVKHWLYGDDGVEPTDNIFDTNIIEVRDGNKLIAVGIFDRGRNCIAGIMNFYDPEYKKFSLGKYLILLKMQYAVQNGMHWYYPGYIVAGFPSFDYKLFVGEENSEVYIPEKNSWYKYSQTLINTFSNMAEKEE